MRGWLGWLGAIALTATAAAPGRAGLYNTSESYSVDNAVTRLSPRDFKHFLISLRSVPAGPEAPADALRLRYLMAEWATSAKLATPIQKASLAEVWARRQRTDEAHMLLKELERSNPDDFLIQSNLAAVCYMKGLDDHAVTTLIELLAKWPASGVSEKQAEYLAGIGWTEDHPYRFYRECETYYLKLIELRRREKIKKLDRLETVDDIFTDAKGSPVRFVGESGKFEVGKIAKAERDKLPKTVSDAVATVKQLLIWMPNDGRLYRLLGELYNVQGGEKPKSKSGKEEKETPAEQEARMDLLKGAAEVFSDLTHFQQIFKFRSEDVRERRDALGDYDFTIDRPFINPDDPIRPTKQDQQGDINWRTVGVSFGVGFVAALFVSWQVREWRRRRV